MNDQLLLVEIERLFNANDDAEEFAPTDRSMPYVVFSAGSASPSWLYSPKPANLFHYLTTRDQSPPDDLALVGRFGLPSESDLSWIERIAADRPIFFIGDLDPVDLLTFAWMRAQTPASQLRYIGVSDRLLRAAEMTISEQVTISLSSDERGALELVAQALPDLTDLIGPDCQRLLAQQKKIEVEALVSFGPQFLSAVYSACPAM